MTKKPKNSENTDMIAQRALAEAEERRAKSDTEGKTLPAETGGRNGPDPVRYGDWEKNGIASDF